MGRLGAAWKALWGEGSKAADSAFGLLPGTMYGSQGPRRGTRELLIAYKSLPYLHSTLRRISKDVSHIPWKVYSARGGAKAKSVAADYASAAGEARPGVIAKGLKAGDLTEVVGHPFLDTLNRWNPALRAKKSQQAVQLYLDLIGQAPIIHEANGLGQPVELWPVPPHWVADVPHAGRPYYRVSWGSWQREIPEEHVTWLSEIDPLDLYGRGSSFGEALSDELDLDEMRAKYGRAFFANSARPDILVSSPAIASREQARQLEEDWMARHQGPNKAGGIRITPGQTQVTVLQQTLQQMQFQEQRAESRRLLQEVFNIPPEILGVLESSNRSTIEAAYYLYAKGALVPRKDEQCDSLQPLLSRWDERLVLGYENPVPEDVESQRAHMVAVPTAFRLNEHRKAGGAPPLEGEEGEALFQPPAAVSAFGQVALSAGDPPWVKSLMAGRVQQKAPGAVDAALAALLPERLTDSVTPVQEELFAFWGSQAMTEVGVQTSFDMRNPLVRQRLEQAGRRITACTDTTRAAIAGTLTEGASAGEGIEELRKRVEAVFEDADARRARTIARTEVVGNSNAANLEGWRQSGVVDGKEWVTGDMTSSPDDVRKHEKMHGQRVGLDESFTSPLGHKCQHPGGFGRPEEDINCMCTAVPVVNDPTKTWTPEFIGARRKSVAANVLKWEEKMEEAVRAGFRKQREDVLRAMR